MSKYLSKSYKQGVSDGYSCRPKNYVGKFIEEEYIIGYDDGLKDRGEFEKTEKKATYDDYLIRKGLIEVCFQCDQKQLADEIVEQKVELEKIKKEESETTSKVELGIISGRILRKMERISYIVEKYEKANIDRYFRKYDRE